MVEEILKERYLIIGGTTKAATTSIYYYLSSHPQVGVSSLKETRFFIDENYPVPPLSYHWLEGVNKYQEFYTNCQDKLLRVEATPDYLYSTGTPQRIKQTLPNSKVVFILRDPISRLISWYKYAKQRADIAESTTFESYIYQQLQGGFFTKAKQYRQNSKDKDFIPQEYFFCSLEHGCYYSYLKAYWDVLGSEKVKVIFYEDLCRQPEIIMSEICDFAGIEASFYADYDFKVFNRSDKMRNPWLHGTYDRLRSEIRKYTHNLPIHELLRQLRQALDPIYYRFNTLPPEEVAIAPNLRKNLQQYYQKDIQQLENLLDYSVPWQGY